jgi:probable F420-dependent oxidoreductase
MRFGLIMYATDDTIDPVSLGRAAEERGFESLFFPEHTHIPVASRRPVAGRAETEAGTDKLEGYAHAYDPFVALSVVAATTTTLKLGTGVCLVVQRDPITTAKAVASLDRLSGGRLLFGVGAGWNRAEMANHGTDPADRMAVFAERMHAMRAIWTQDEAAYHGRHVDFDRIWSWPKPITKPYPPILVGGNGTSVEDRVLDFGDEWLPQRVTMANVTEFGRRAAALQRRAGAQGRGPIPITLFAAQPDPATIEAYADVGITRCLFTLPDSGPDTVLPLLDRLAKVITETSVASQ